ncbi:MAG: hypothetical protein ABJH68_10520 [Ilumatobacter sp.]
MLQVFPVLEADHDTDAARESPVGHRSGEPDVMVSMFDDQLVICPPAHLDLETTEVIVVAAASAVTSGSTVMIDLDPDTASGELIARRPLSAATARCVTGPGGPVAIPSAGYVRLATRDSHWTIDLAHGRLCRSDSVVDPHFVAPGSWTRIQALWVTITDVTALTVDGTYLSTHAAWTLPRRRTRLTAV